MTLAVRGFAQDGDIAEHTAPKSLRNPLMEPSAMSNKLTSPTKARRTRAALGVLAIAGAVASGVAMAPGAFAAENHTAQASPAATAPATTGHDGDTLDATGQKTKGFVVANHTGKKFHFVNWKGEYQGSAYENALPGGTGLAPGSEHRWEMLDRYETCYAWITYAADDGSSQITIQTVNDALDIGHVGTVTIQGGINYQIGDKGDAHLITLNN
jgi:hypothetical protein